MDQREAIGTLGFPRRPRLVASVHADSDGVRVGDTHKIYGAALTPTELHGVLARMDGKVEFDDLVASEPGLSSASARELLGALDADFLVDDDRPPPFVSGADLVLDLEDIVDAACAATIFRNPFWKFCLAAAGPGDMPLSLATGMAVENWHFLHRESYFDAPVLSYVPSTSVRLLLNQFFSEEYGHDEILLRSLNAVGLSREDMADAIPLPETMALCNALAMWAHTDPLFFFATLGLLEGQGMEHDSFLEACGRAQLPEAFVGPLRTHANINLNAAHGNLTRAIFRAIPAIDLASAGRLKRQAILFVELYDAFYSAVFRCYGGGGNFRLRRVSEL